MTEEILKDLVVTDNENLDELDNEIIEDIKISPKLESKVASLLKVHKDAIQEIVEVEENIYVVTVETDEDVFVNFSYSSVDDSYL